MTIHVDDGMNLLRTILEVDKNRRQIECALLAKEVTQVPVSDHLLTRLCELGLDFPNVISSHPGFVLDRKMKSLWAALETFRLAYADFEINLKKFDTHNQENRTNRKDKEFQRIVAAVIKEIFATCSAASALKAHAQRVRRDLVPEKEFLIQLGRSFDREQHQFVIKLRNVLTHEMFVEANWRITYHFGSDARKVSSFEFSSEQLIAAGDFNNEAKSYMARCGEKINVSTLFAEYSARVMAFYKWLGERIESQLPVEVMDYRRCVSAHKAHMARINWRLILRQVVDTGLDPYQYLDRYLESEELDEIKRLPPRSVAQVSRIVQLIDEHGACDEELRELVFRLFMVGV